MSGVSLSLPHRQNLEIVHEHPATSQLELLPTLPSRLAAAIPERVVDHIIMRLLAFGL